MRPGTYVALVLAPVIGANRRASSLATTVTRSEPQRSSTGRSRSLSWERPPSSEYGDEQGRGACAIGAQSRFARFAGLTIRLRASACRYSSPAGSRHDRLSAFATDAR